MQAATFGTIRYYRQVQYARRTPEGVWRYGLGSSCASKFFLYASPQSTGTPFSVSNISHMELLACLGRTVAPEKICMVGCCDT